MKKRILTGLGIALTFFCVSSITCAQTPAPQNSDLQNPAPQTLYYDGTGSQNDTPWDAASYEKHLKSVQKRREEIETALTNKQNLKGNELFLLGARLNQGYADDKVDLTTAYDLYELAAAKGDVRAIQLMCTAYLLGINRPVNIAKGMNDYCNKLSVKNPTLQFSVGYDYEHGLSGPKDETAALNYYLAAAKAGNAEAMNILGLKLLALPDKTTEAREWFRQSTRAGSANGMFNLAKMTEAGDGVLQDAKEAQWLYVNAARLGHSGALTWLQTRNDITPIKRVNLYTPKGELIHIVKNNDPKNTKKFIFKDYILSFIDAAEKGPVTAQLHCYINENNKIDTCITIKEYPPFIDYGRNMQTIFSQNLIADQKDVNGNPTAQTVYAFAFNFSIK